MPINCLIKCLINFWAFARFVFQNKLLAFNESNSWTLMAQKNGPFALRLFVSSSLCLFDSSSLRLFVSLTPQKDPCVRCISAAPKPFPLGRGWGRLLFDSLSLSLFDSLSLCREVPAKNQQFWAIFQRFDINIFNLREHFSPPNFAYSARNFSLPSPNLN